jgi:hypothetical protein
VVRPRDSRRVPDPKIDEIDEIEAAGIDYMAAVNPGCLGQLRQGYAAGNQHCERCVSPISCAWQPADEPPSKPASSMRAHPAMLTAISSLAGTGR